MHRYVYISESLGPITNTYMSGLVEFCEGYFTFTKSAKTRLDYMSVGQPEGKWTFVKLKDNERVFPSAILKKFNDFFKIEDKLTYF